MGQNPSLYPDDSTSKNSISAFARRSWKLLDAMRERLSPATVDRILERLGRSDEPGRRQSAAFDSAADQMRATMEKLASLESRRKLFEHMLAKAERSPFAQRGLLECTRTMLHAAKITTGEAQTELDGLVRLLEREGLPQRSSGLDASPFHHAYEKLSSMLDEWEAHSERLESYQDVTVTRLDGGVSAKFKDGGRLAGIEIDEGWAWKKTPEELSRALTEVLSAQEGRTRAEHRAPRKV